MDEYVQCENSHDIIPIENYNDHLDICLVSDQDEGDENLGFPHLEFSKIHISIHM